MGNGDEEAKVKVKPIADMEAMLELLHALNEDDGKLAQRSSLTGYLVVV
jgi:hypothetical protein